MIDYSILVRILLVFILSSFFGLERQRSHKPVGFGTFIFVALGACIIGIIATKNNIDSSISLLAATITGIGFLGAGALIKSTDKVFGFNMAFCNIRIDFGNRRILHCIHNLHFGLDSYFI